MLNGFDWTLNSAVGVSRERAYAAPNASYTSTETPIPATESKLSSDVKGIAQVEQFIVPKLMTH